MIRGRVKVSVRVRDWRLMGRVYGWAKVRFRLTKLNANVGSSYG